MEVYKRTTVYLKEKYLQALPAAGVTNKSRLFNHILELVLMLDRPDYSDLKQAQIVAETVRSELSQQQKLIEQEEEKKEKFLTEASKLFAPKIKYYQSILPESEGYNVCSRRFDPWDVWVKSAFHLTESCGYKISVDDCWSYVRVCSEGVS